MSVCACMGGPNCCRRRNDYSGISPQLWREVNDAPPVHIDIERMKRALEGPRWMVPSGMSSEEVIAYMNEVAEHIDTTGGVSVLLP